MARELGQQAEDAPDADADAEAGGSDDPSDPVDMLAAAVRRSASLMPQETPMALEYRLSAPGSAGTR